jgi:hypothetical protein
MSLLFSVSIALAAASLSASDGSDIPEHVLDALEGYEVTDEQRSCASTHRILDIRVIDDRNWLFKMHGSQSFLNTMGRGCRDADDPFSYMVYQSYGSQLCRGDVIRLVDRGGIGATRASCILGRYRVLNEVPEKEEQESSETE